MRKGIFGLFCFILSTLVLLLPMNGQSVNVAIVGSPNILNGGTLPTNSGIYPEFAPFTFANITRTQLESAATLDLYDTLVLNVASYASSPTYGLGCNLSTYLSATARTAIVTWLATGKKLIIYDSECPTQNYSWLPYPFTTYNPGATGSFSGFVTVVEDNPLSTKVGNPTCTGLTGWVADKCINTTALTANTDAVGDMNVMVTYDSHWCLDMSGTNVYQRTGPVHTYAKYPEGTDKGVIIYNGFDMDYNTYTSSGAAMLRKIFLQELQQPFNPSGTSLPCGVVVAGIKLSPATALRQVLSNHTETATLTDLVNSPVPGKLVTFTVTGANPTGTPAPTATTNATGKALLTYAGANIGWDNIVGSFVATDGTTVNSQPAKVQWINCDFNGDTSVNLDDLNLLKVQIGNSSSANTLMDNDGDGWITSSDARRCALVCTKTGCAR